MRFRRIELSPANRRQYTFALGRKDIELLMQESLNAHRYMPNTPELRESKQRLSKITRAFYEALEVAKQDGDDGARVPIQDRQKYKTELTKNPLLDITRFEIIDYRSCPNCDGRGTNDDHICDECGGARILGRTPIFDNQNLVLKSSVQDEGRTLKIFIDKREL